MKRYALISTVFLLSILTVACGKPEESAQAKNSVPPIPVQWQTLKKSTLSVLDIQQRCRKTKALWQQLTGRLWHVYKAPSKRHFAQRLRRLGEWAIKGRVKQKTILQRLLNLKGKSAQFQVAYDHPDAARTSNMLARLMNYQDRLLYTMQYFHGSEKSARLYLRAMALIWNFHPYGSRTKANASQRCSPFKDLNGFHAP